MLGRIAIIDVNQVRSLLEIGMTDLEIARSFQCSRCTIGNIRRKNGFTYNPMRSKPAHKESSKKVVKKENMYDPCLHFQHYNLAWSDKVRRSMSVIEYNGHDVVDQFPVIYINGKLTRSQDVVRMADDILNKQPRQPMLTMKGEPCYA